VSELTRLRRVAAGTDQGIVKLEGLDSVQRTEKKTDIGTGSEFPAVSEVRRGK
jgi:hypothetical protein